MHKDIIKQIEEAKRIIVIQAENPDGDSIGSALALEEILGDLGKEILLYCPVQIPKYLRYISGWDRISTDFDTSVDLAIIVDTAAKVLLSRVLEKPGVKHFLETNPVVIIDHHPTEATVNFAYYSMIDNAISTGELIYKLALEAKWPINQQAAEHLMITILSDSLGLTIQNVTAETFFITGELAKLGASSYEIEERRREYMKKAPEILKYKGQLIERIEYFLDGKLALVHVPWEEIEQYSDQYNPAVLVIDEMRFVEGVEVCIVIKTYPDGKLTCKLRSNTPVSANIAGHFGGGGHLYAAGFRVYESIDTIMPELLNAVESALKEYQNDTKTSQHTDR